MKKRICLLPEARSLGGPRSFQRTLIEWAKNSEMYEVDFDASKLPDAYLVIGAPKQFLGLLLRARMKGIPVVLRLNGMNWIHRVQDCGVKYFLHSELANLAIAFYRRFVCTKIVYQSPFCESRWNQVYGNLKKKNTIIYNGVNTSVFTPAECFPDPSAEVRVLAVEGSFLKGMDFGLDIAAELIRSLAERFQQPIRLLVAGKVDETARTRLQKRLEGSQKAVCVEFLGVLSREELAAEERSATLFFSSEIHAACPNSVIEAMSCGLPVIGYDTAALKDVVGEGGIIVPYGSDPWKLERPRLSELADAAETVIKNNAAFRSAAEERARKNFTREKMALAYMDFCLKP